MNSGVGALGAFVLAIGGAISFEALYNLLEVYKWNSTSSFGSPSFGADIIGFIG